MNEAIETTATKKQPVLKLAIGRIKIAVWSNTTSRGEMFSITATRSYKVGEVWKETSSFGADDLPGLVKALEEAHTFIRSRVVATQPEVA